VCVVYFHVRAGLSGQYSVHGVFPRLSWSQWFNTVCVVYFHVRAGVSGQYSVRGVSEVPR